MFEHFFEAPNLPFAVSLLVMGGIGLFEAIALAFGGGVSSAVESALPEGLDVGGPDLGGTDLAASPDALAGGHGFFSTALDWLHVGRVPILIVLVLLLFGFGVAGLAIQAVAHGAWGDFFPAWLAALVAFPISLPFVRISAKGVARILPRDETTAVPRASFVGASALIVLGTATRGAPAQAKLKDRHGQTHYVLVEPAEDGEGFPQGSLVILVEAQGAIFTAIHDSAPQLESTH